MTGSGKSYFCNGLLGYGNPDKGVFGTGSLGTSCTRKPAGMHAQFYNDVLVAHGVESMAINLFDTPGFADSDKCQIEANKQRIVEKFDKPIDVFGYLMHPENPRIDYNQQGQFSIVQVSYDDTLETYELNSIFSYFQKFKRMDIGQYLVESGDYLRTHKIFK